MNKAAAVRVLPFYFLRATQRPQGWAAMEQAWPGRSLPEIASEHAAFTFRPRELAAVLAG